VVLLTVYSRRVRRGILILAILLAGGVAWVWRGSAISAWIDGWVTTGRKRLPATFTYDGGGFRSGDVSLTFAETDNLRHDLTVSEGQSGYAVLIAHGQNFPLGTHLAPDPGDDISLEFRRGAVWPAWKEFSIMGGPFPRWRRYCYYSLRWKKASGTVLEMHWRYQQIYYSRKGWTEPLMMWNSQTGLTSLSIRNPQQDAVVRYVDESKRWKPAEYRIDQLGQDRFAVIHCDDGAYPGAGKSIVVKVDLETGKVLGETGGQ